MSSPTPRENESVTLIPGGRDYVAEVRALIDEAISQGPYSAPLLARQLVEKLRANDPELLEGWLDLGAENHLREVIIKIDRVSRTQMRQAHRVAGAKSVFDATGKQPSETDQRAMFDLARRQYEESGDPSALNEFRSGGWLATRFVVDGLRKPLGSLTGTQVTVVADAYRRNADPILRQEAFLRAIAKRVGPNRTVEEVYSNEKLIDLWVTVNGS